MRTIDEIRKQIIQKKSEARAVFNACIYLQIDVVGSGGDGAGGGIGASVTATVAAETIPNDKLHLRARTHTRRQ